MRGKKKENAYPKLRIKASHTSEKGYFIILEIKFDKAQNTQKYTHEFTCTNALKFSMYTYTIKFENFLENNKNSCLNN